MLRKLKRNALIVLEDLLLPRFGKVRVQGRGLLTARIYKAIYQPNSRLHGCPKEMLIRMVSVFGFSPGNDANGYRIET